MIKEGQEYPSDNIFEKLVTVHKDDACSGRHSRKAQRIRVYEEGKVIMQLFRCTNCNGVRDWKPKN